MKLRGKVIKAIKGSYTNKTTGAEVPQYHAYLESGDPLSGALELSLTEEQFQLIKVGNVLSFVPSFSTRTWNRAVIVTAKVFEDLEVVKA
ncbi:MAG: hypothetical protein Q8K48_06580 [Candidatus Planktophila sp.]|nr:hypothetical protein [Candidatus Planktophila sp.]